MKLALFGLYLFAVSACCSQVEQPGFEFTKPLDQRQMFNAIESFFGREFDGKTISGKERSVEQFYADWDGDALWGHLLERRGKIPAGTVLRRYPNALTVLFVFFHRKNGLWDTSEKQLVVRLDQGRVKSAFWLESNYFGLTKKPSSLEPQAVVQSLAENYFESPTKAE